MSGTRRAESLELEQSALASKRPRTEAPIMTIEDLPIDCLSVIFSFLFLQPRLRSVSVVCKRWRRAVLRSVKSIATNNVPETISLFPSLTELEVRSAKESIPFTFPTSLRRLKMSFANSVSDVDFAVVDPLPPLSQLSLNFWSESHLAERLMSRSSSSLVSLELTLRDSAPSCLRDLHFPALESLSITYALPASASKCSSIVTPFLRTHCSLLTSLSLIRQYSGRDVQRHTIFAFIPALLYPALRNLTLRGISDDRLDDKISAPSLRTLSLADIGDVQRISCSLRTCLTDIHVPHLRHANMYDDIPSLESIWGDTTAANFVSLQSTPTFRARLMNLHTAKGSIADTWRALQFYTNMRRLDLFHTVPPDAAPLYLPFLERLTLQCAGDGVLDTVRFFLRAAPALTRITCNLDNCDEDVITLEELQLFTKELLRHGVRKASIWMPKCLMGMSEWAQQVTREGWMRLNLYEEL